jgi:hypothetical protein
MTLSSVSIAAGAVVGGPDRGLAVGANSGCGTGSIVSIAISGKDSPIADWSNSIA